MRDWIPLSRIVRDAILPQRCAYLTDQHWANWPEDYDAQDELSKGQYPAEGRYAGLGRHRVVGSLAFLSAAYNSKPSPDKSGYRTSEFWQLREATGRPDDSASMPEP